MKKENIREENSYIDSNFKKIFAYFTLNRKIAFLFTFIVGMLLHFNKYSQNLMTTDAYGVGTTGELDTWGIQIGRWLVPVFFENIHLGINSNLLSTIFAILILGIVSVLINDFFEIKSKLLIVINSIALVVFPYTANILIFNAWTFNVALLFCIFAAKYIYQNTKKSIVLGIVFTILVLAIYQCDIAVIVTLLVTRYFIDFIKDKTNLKESIKKLLVLAGTLIVSFIIYYVISIIIARIYKLEFASYGGFNNNTNSFYNDIFLKIRKCYINFFDYYFANRYINNSYYELNWLHGFTFLFIIMGMLTIIYNTFMKNEEDMKQCIIKLVLLVTFVIAFPLLLNIFDLVISLDFDFNITMSAGNVLPIVIFTYLIEYIMDNNIIQSNHAKKCATYICIILLSAQLYIYSFVGEATYIALEKNYKQIYNTLIRTIDRIENNEEYVKGMPIFITRAYNLEYASNLDIFYKANLNRLGVFGVVENAVLPTLFKEEFNIDVNSINIDNKGEIINSTEYEEMGIFPAKNSIRVIKGIMVVKY